MFSRTQNLLIITIIISAFLLPSIAFAKRDHSEMWYIQQWCKPRRGIERAVLNDGTRCDCMTDEYVMEIEYADKWKNAIGKVLHYSLQTGKRSTIVLILENPRANLYFKQLKMLVSYFQLPIDVWQVGSETEKTTEEPAPK